MGPFVRKHMVRLLGPVLFGYLLYRSNLGEVSRHLFDVDLGVYVWVLPLSWLAIGARALRWRRLVQGSRAGLSVMQGFAYYLGGVFWGAITPGRVGELTRIKYLRDHGVGMIRAVTTVLVDRLMDVLSLVAIALVPLVMLADRLHVALGPAAVYGGAILGVAVAGALIGLAGLRTGGGWLRRSPVGAKAVRAMEACAAAWREVRGIGGSVWLYAIALTAASWVVFFLTRIIIAWSLGMEMDIWFFSGVIAVSALLSLLPITVQGVGTRDVTLIFFLGWVGVPGEQALALSALILALMLVNTGLARIVYLAYRPSARRDRDPAVTG